VDICSVEEYGRSGGSGSGFLLAVNIIICLVTYFKHAMFIYFGDYLTLAS
jgi:hypothetical protein